MTIYSFKTYTTGFSLIEVMVVIGIMGILAQVSLGFGIDAYKRVAYKSDKTLLLAALGYARAEAQNHVCSSTHEACAQVPNHGVYVSPTQLIIFEGTTYLTRAANTDLVIPFALVETSLKNTSVVFAANSGNLILSASSSTTLTLLRPDKSTELLTIASTGQIHL